MDKPNQLIHVSQLSKTLPSNRGQHIAPSTLARWCMHGVKLPDGSRLYLQGQRTPSGWCSTPEWVREFFDAMTAASRPGHAPPPPGLAERDRQARKRLAKVGF
jgi:hypothetical protein